MEMHLLPKAHEGIHRRTFLAMMGVAGAALAGMTIAIKPAAAEAVSILEMKKGEDIFAFINREKGKFDQTRYQQVIGAANDFKEGDLTIGVGARDDATRKIARKLLANTKIAVTRGTTWNKRKIDHDITKLACNIADTALDPREAARETITIIREMVGKQVNNSCLLGKN